MSPTSFTSIWALAFLTSSMNVWTRFLYSPHITCPYFHPLCSSFLSLSLARSNLFIHRGLLAFLYDFSFFAGEPPWARRGCSLNTTQIPCIPPPSGPYPQVALRRIPFKRTNSTLLKCKAINLLFSPSPLALGLISWLNHLSLHTRRERHKARAECSVQDQLKEPQWWTTSVKQPIIQKKQNQSGCVIM